MNDVRVFFRDVLLGVAPSCVGGAVRYFVTLNLLTPSLLPGT